MTEIGGMSLEMRGRKRKLPFNWDDVYQSSSEDEKNIIKKKVLLVLATPRNISDSLFTASRSQL